MTRTVVHGAIVAVLAALLAAIGSAIGIPTIWPVLLGVAVGLAVWPMSLGRVGAFALGAVVSWGVMALRAGVLPDLGLSRALIVLIGIVLIAAVAVVTADHVPLWAGLVGYAAFAALYEPMFADSPTLFLSESPGALLTVLLSGGVGLAIAGLADLLTGPPESDEILGERPAAARSEEGVL